MLEAVSLTKRYGIQTALDTLNLRVDPGEVFCLLGANGAGKTTTIDLFLNFIEPTSGTARINGIDVTEQPLETKRHLAYIPETVMLYKNLTGLENLEYFSALAGRADFARDQLLEFFKRVGLAADAADRRVSAYSKGMRTTVTSIRGVSDPLRQEHRTSTGGWQRGSLTPRMPPSLLLTDAPTATRAARSAARCDAAKSYKAKDMVESMCPATTLTASRVDSEHDAREGEHCSRVCVPPSFYLMWFGFDVTRVGGRPMGLTGSSLDPFTFSPSFASPNAHRTGVAGGVPACARRTLLPA
jgi:ABC-type transporter Mla maintaining outer membrane lipid asymmetry ATPase subunit MlaF